jgi:hypothetical protein
VQEVSEEATASRRWQRAGRAVQLRGGRWRRGWSRGRPVEGSAVGKWPVEARPGRGRGAVGALQGAGRGRASSGRPERPCRPAGEGVSAGGGVGRTGCGGGGGRSGGGGRCRRRRRRSAELGRACVSGWWGRHERLSARVSAVCLPFAVRPATANTRRHFAVCLQTADILRTVCRVHTHGRLFFPFTFSLYIIYFIRLHIIHLHIMYSPQIHEHIWVCPHE